MANDIELYSLIGGAKFGCRIEVALVLAATKTLRKRDPSASPLQRKWARSVLKSPRSHVERFRNMIWATEHILDDTRTADDIEGILKIRIMAIVEESIDDFAEELV